MPSKIVLSEIRCTSCGKRRIRTPGVGGDYYKTEEGYRCQEYCNGDCDKNGILYPPISGVDPDFISNRGKSAVGGKIAGIFKLPFGESKKIAKDVESNNQGVFAIIYAKRISIFLKKKTKSRMEVSLLDVWEAINSLG